MTPDYAEIEKFQDFLNLNMLCVDWYVMPEGGGTPIAIKQDVSEAQKYQSEGLGVFYTVNDFMEKPRRRENLHKINMLHAEMDDGTKSDQLRLINKSPMRPSLIIESKRGFHILFLIDDCSPSQAERIIKDRLGPYFGADKKAMDLCRILRVPGFYHLKQINDPFLVRIRSQSKAVYRPKHFDFAFRDQKPDRGEYERKEQRSSCDSLWGRIFNFDCREGLERLSGQPDVNGEVYELNPIRSGNTNIKVDGKGIGCFINSDGRIPLCEGGPTIYHWLKWYTGDKQKTLDALQRHIPEIFDGIDK